MRTGLAILISFCLLLVQVFNAPRLRQVKGGRSSLSSLPRATMAQVSSLGNVRAMADWYWIQSVLYFAQHWLTDQDYRPMEHALDLVTDLQPYAEEPYVIGGWMLCDGPRSCPQTTNLALKATVWNQNSWALLEQMGILIFLEQRENRTAAGMFRIARNRPGAPVSLHALEGYMWIRGGEEERAKAFYTQLYHTAPTPQLRHKAAVELKRYVMVSDLRQLQAALQEYVDAYNELPPDVAALDNFKAGEMPRSDPFGGAYRVDPAGVVTTTSKDQLLILQQRYMDKNPLKPVSLRRYYGPEPPEDLKANTPSVLDTLTP